MCPISFVKDVLVRPLFSPAPLPLGTPLPSRKCTLGNQQVHLTAWSMGGVGSPTTFIHPAWPTRLSWAPFFAPLMPVGGKDYPP